MYFKISEFSSHLCNRKKMTEAWRGRDCAAMADVSMSVGTSAAATLERVNSAQFEENQVVEYKRHFMRPKGCL